MPTPNQIFTTLGLWQWWEDTPTQPFNGVTEKGDDFASTYGTPVGAIEGGQVIQVQHNNNSINDVVVVAGHTGYWVYQHITSKVQPGQIIGTGTVVGTQNGLPKDQFSTGSHIEVRFASQWKQGVDPYMQTFSDPREVFNRVGSTVSNDALPPIGSGSSQVVASDNANTLGGQSQGFINDQLNSFFNPIVGQAETGFLNFVETGILVTIALVAIGFGFFLLIPHSDNSVGASSSNLQTARALAKVAE
jgi:murein DD-endopeptidase MepM/ murein hydrolase activator NlpD